MQNNLTKIQTKFPQVGDKKVKLKPIEKNDNLLAKACSLLERKQAYQK